MERSRGTWFWLVPSGTFVVGLLLGGILVAVGAGGDGDGSTDTADRPRPVPSATATPSRQADRTITVPGACLDAVDASEKILALGREAASRISELDARELQRIVNEMQQLDAQVRELAGACRNAAASR